MRIDRKKGIPEGIYCYKLLSVEYTGNPKKPVIMKVQNCKYLRSRRGGKRSHNVISGTHYDYCKLLRAPLMDCCKDCGINDDTDELIRQEEMI